MRITVSNIVSLPTKYGVFKIQSFQEKLDKGELKEHLLIFTNPILSFPNLRVHSECLTGDAIGSLKCDCAEQLQYALEYISKHKGMVYIIGKKVEI